jgi:hypothetical protein
MYKLENSIIGRAYAVSRSEGTSRLSDSTQILCVDTANCAPQEMKHFSVLNPFYFEPFAAIPVPRQKAVACSVESIWQGLKIVGGETDFSMFARLPEKRPPESARNSPGYIYNKSEFLYGKEVVDLVTARWVIYLPTYLYLLEKLAPLSLIEDIFTGLYRGVDVFFYDWDDNHDINNPASSFSHSAILAAWFNGTLEQEFVEPGCQFIQSNLSTDDPASILAPNLQRYRFYQSVIKSV